MRRAEALLRPSLIALTRSTGAYQARCYHAKNKIRPTRYIFQKDDSVPDEIAAINREEASNSDLFHTTLTARLREDNKRATAIIRKAGWIPSYFRGRNKMPDLLIQVRPEQFVRDYEEGRFARQAKGRVLHTGPLYELRMEAGTVDEDGQELDVSWVPFERVRVQVQNVRIHSLTDRPNDLQLTYFPENEPVRVRVPIVVINEEKCPGLREGGWINRLVKYVDINVAPFTKPPEMCTLDIAGMHLKDRRRVGDLMFAGKGEGCRLVLPDDVETTMISKV